VVSQFEALWRLGLKPENTFIAGKPYSTNRLAALLLRQRGCTVRTGFEGFHSDDVLSPDWYQNLHYGELGGFLARSLGSALDNGCKTIVILDDGGLFLNWIVKLGREEYDTGDTKRADRLARRMSNVRVVGVEQTTFGRRLVAAVGGQSMASTRHASSTGWPIPVVSVASSRLKMERESELIARSVVSEVRSFLAASDRVGEHVADVGEATVGVVGFGAVGSWVYRALSSEPDRYRAPREVLVYDSDRAKTSIARSVGYPVAHSLDDLARRCQIIVGCTGVSSGLPFDFSLRREPIVLASASSGNHEFAPVFIRGREREPSLNPDIVPQRDATTFDWIHSIYELVADGVSAFVLNGGFPVNFTGGVDPIPAREIELTRCLMVAGVATALETKAGHDEGVVRLVDLDESIVTELFAS
jgi:hypothetical protein